LFRETRTASSTGKTWSLISTLGDETIPLDSFVAKAHLIVERELYAFLALRLGIGERQLPALSFYTLTKLALSDDAYSHAERKLLRSTICETNTLTNLTTLEEVSV
jgi:hypothetical protein